jgi:hypothetical protein
VSGGGLLVPSTGTRVVLDGNAPQAILLISGTSGSRISFQDLEISNSAGVELLRDATVAGDLELIGQPTVPGPRALTITGTLFLRASSVLDNQGTINLGACVREAGHTIVGTDPC